MLKDVKTGEVKTTKKFNEKHGQKFAEAGHNVNKSFESENHLIGAAASVALTDDAADAILELLKEK